MGVPSGNSGLMDTHCYQLEDGGTLCRGWVIDTKNVACIHVHHKQEGPPHIMHQTIINTHLWFVRATQDSLLLDCRVLLQEATNSPTPCCKFELESSVLLGVRIHPYMEWEGSFLVTTEPAPCRLSWRPITERKTSIKLWPEWQDFILVTGHQSSVHIGTWNPCCNF